VLRQMLAQGAGWPLSTMHAHNVFHRDVKLTNVLVGDDGPPVLCDFGVSEVHLRKCKGEKCKEKGGGGGAQGRQMRLCWGGGPCRARCPNARLEQSCELHLQVANRVFEL
jgi:serine/threonine protein kinase